MTRVTIAVEQLRRQVPGGIGRYATGLLSGLRQVDAPAVELLASRPRARSADPLAAWGFEVRASPLPTPWLTFAWDHGLASVRGVPLVHAVSLAAPPVRPTARRGGPALVVTVHDLAWRTNPDATTPRGRRWHEGALRRALRAADAFVVPSRPVADALHAAGAEEARIRVVAHGADHLPPPDTARAAALLAQAGVRGGYLLAAATLEPRKNLRRLTAAFTAARSALAGDWPLVVVGPAGWGDTGIGNAEGVVATGAVDDAVLSGLYAGARAFAYVPLVEGFGLPPVEAMIAGVPVVVSTAVPSTMPQADAEPAALRVDPTTVDAIAAALVRISGDDALRASLVRRGSALVRPLTWEASASAHVEWWGHVA